MFELEKDQEDSPVIERITKSRRTTVSPSAMFELGKDQEDSPIAERITKSKSRRTTVSPSAMFELEKDQEEEFKESDIENTATVFPSEMMEVDESTRFNKDRRETVSPSAMLELMANESKGTIPPTNEETPERRKSIDQRRNIFSPSALLGLDDSFQASEEDTPRAARINRRSTISPSAVLDLDQSFDDTQQSPLKIIPPRAFGEVKQTDAAPMANPSSPMNPSPEKKQSIGKLVRYAAEVTEFNFEGTPKSTKKLLRSCLSGRKAKRVATPGRNVVFGSPRTYTMVIAATLSS